MTKAIVLCGGKGTRLRPYTYSIPKPMLPLGRKPILEYVVQSLKENGITEMVFTVGYLKEQIISHFGDGKKLGVKISYSEEQHELNTAGSIKPIESQLKDTFVVLMGDHLSLLDIKKMLKFHAEQGALATIALKRQGVPLEYGIAHMEGDRITSFQEKPIIQNLVNSGVYVLEPEIFKYIKEGDDFARDVFPKLLADKKKISGFVFDSYWLDIGRTTDYEQMNRMISVIELATGRKQ
jgi:NDP-sugar pyrophosphorylase family protein